MKRILLSVPHAGLAEQEFVRQAFEENWLSTVGPHLRAFEQQFEARFSRCAVALSSGTAAIHLGLRALGVQPGDDVFCPTLTFVATANPIAYLGARPVFLDSDPSNWNLDADLLARTLRRRARINRLPKAVIVVHLYGQACDMDPILDSCARYEIPVLEDAAEALGSTYKNRPAGALGAMGVFSFNGNKIITTAGGGMLLTDRPETAEQARQWATQARDPAPWYQHSQMGFNYRLSNVLAGIGRGQMDLLDTRIRQRRALAFRYRDAFADVPGIGFMPQAAYGLHTNWLSCFLIDAPEFGCTRDDVIHALDQAGIESRPVWKPMHLQPLYAHSEHLGGAVAEGLFHRGICLPSSSSLTLEDQAYVIAQVRRAAGMPEFVSAGAARA
ncbi:MAG TPA: aminotransferase class I/II-fold pyridoxal phosphate-dependent enzyme [Bryobacteraceae bacterium]|jgi:pyridoxal phosphate-dependent aminotransferase EpsN